VLIDPQYAPRVIARPNADGMIKLLQETARFETVNLFRRFALMRHWHQVERLPFEAFLSPDELQRPRKDHHPFQIPDHFPN
jgi:hypothetical protein